MFLGLDLFYTFLPFLLKGHDPAEMFDEITSYKKKSVENLYRDPLGELGMSRWNLNMVHNEYYGNIYGLGQSNQQYASCRVLIVVAVSKTFNGAPYSIWAGIPLEPTEVHILRFNLCE